MCCSPMTSLELEVIVRHDVIAVTRFREVMNNDIYMVLQYIDVQRYPD